MKIVIQNQAKVANKYIRFIKWRLRRVNEKFSRPLLYADIFIGKEGANPTQFTAVIKIGIPGKDLLISKKAKSIKELWGLCAPIVERQFRKTKQKNRNQITQLS